MSKNISLEEEVRKLRAENEELSEEKKTLLKQNQDLNDRLRGYEEEFEKQTECVKSLKDLTEHDREWLDLEVSQRREQMHQRRKETEEALSKRRESLNLLHQSGKGTEEALSKRRASMYM